MARSGGHSVTKINLCILGCGSVAKLHSRVARTLRSSINLMFASRSISKAEEYRRRFKGTASFGSYEEACESPEVDAVFICTPHAFHLEQASLAARGGKPMLIEKPVTRTLEELSAVERAVSDAGVLAMVAENYDFKPAVRVLRHHLERGDIGDPMFLELNRVGRSKVKGWRADPELMGGGALLEGGVHWVRYLTRLGGKPESVVAAQANGTRKKIAPHEDALEVLVKFANGSVGKLLHSWASVNRIGGLGMSKIYGTEGNIFFESNGLFAIVLGRRKRLRFPGVLDIMGYRAMLKHFVDCVRNNQKPTMSLQVARGDMEFVSAAYRSLATGRFETLRPH